MASYRQNNDFAGHFFPADPLEKAIDWINTNLSPGDVFDEKDLLAWAREQSPQDIFSEGDLGSTEQ